MRQLNVNVFYQLGKSRETFRNETAGATAEVPISKIAWLLFTTRRQFTGVIEEPCPLVPSSERAARAVVDAISEIVPAEFEEFFAMDMTGNVPAWQLGQLDTALSNFETILNNDLPEMSTYAVGQIGIFRTDALINYAHMQIVASLRPILDEAAKSDIIEAGRCLAFQLPTASAFHLSRAIETGMNQYYEVLANEPFPQNGATRNWAVKTKALKDRGADEKVTEFLDHIRKQYRNPVTHPDERLSQQDAQSFFGPALSAISMMLSQVAEQREKSMSLFQQLIPIPQEQSDE